MKIPSLRFIVPLCSILLLSACFAPKTPQEVAHAFWEAVLRNDAQDAANYSTLSEAKGYDGFGQEWSGFQPTWGKVVIDGGEATVGGEFSRVDSSGTQSRKVVTYLVRQNEAWKVDYVRTGEQMRGDVLGSLFATLGRLGDDLSRQVHSSASDFNAQMEQLGKELEERSQTLGQEAEAGIEQYAEELRKGIDALAESINRALQEKNQELSEKDRRLLREVADDLDKERQHLSSPTLESVVSGSKHLGKAQLRLELLESETLAEYRRQWQALGQRFEATGREMLDELSTWAKGSERRR